MGFSPSTGGTGSGQGRARDAQIEDPELVQWACLCIAKLVWRYLNAQDGCAKLNIQDSLFARLEGYGEPYDLPLCIAFVNRDV